MGVARPVSPPKAHLVNLSSLMEVLAGFFKPLCACRCRSASAAVFGTRTVAHETFFQQHGAALRNSGIPNHQDSAFSLPSKARHRLQKHGLNLL